MYICIYLLKLESSVQVWRVSYPLSSCWQRGTCWTCRPGTGSSWSRPPHTGHCPCRDSQESWMIKHCPHPPISVSQLTRPPASECSAWRILCSRHKRELHNASHLPCPHTPGIIIFKNILPLLKPLCSCWVNFHLWLKTSHLARNIWLPVEAGSGHKLKWKHMTFVHDLMSRALLPCLCLSGDLSVSAPPGTGLLCRV